MIHAARADESPNLIAWARVRGIVERVKQHRLQTFRLGHCGIRFPTDDRCFGHAQKARKVRARQPQLRPQLSNAVACHSGRRIICFDTNINRKKCLLCSRIRLVNCVEEDRKFCACTSASGEGSGSLDRSGPLTVVGVFHINSIEVVHLEHWSTMDQRSVYGVGSSRSVPGFLSP